MRDPNDLQRPMVVLPVKYLNEVKWIPEDRLSFWKHIDKVCVIIIPRISAYLYVDILTTATSNLFSLKSAVLELLRTMPLPQDMASTGP